MRRDVTAAIKAAVNGLYDGSPDSCREALWDVLEALDTDMAELMHENEEAAHLHVNKEDDEEEESEEDVNDLLFDDDDSSSED